MVNDKKTIALIGMPGCGKTSIGRLVAERLGLGFCDLDEKIEKDAGISITEIFKERGEDGFRKLETEALKAALKHGGVVSTGGGIVKRAKNIEAMKKYGFTVFIDRPLENIASDVEIAHRPLLADGVEKLYALYEERYSLYKNAADVIIENTGTVEETAEKIVGCVNSFYAGDN